MNKISIDDFYDKHLLSFEYLNRGFFILKGREEYALFEKEYIADQDYLLQDVPLERLGYWDLLSIKDMGIINKKEFDILNIRFTQEKESKEIAELKRLRNKYPNI